MKTKQANDNVLFISQIYASELKSNACFCLAIVPMATHVTCTVLHTPCVLDLIALDGLNVTESCTITD